MQNLAAFSKQAIRAENGSQGCLQHKKSSMMNWILTFLFITCMSCCYSIMKLEAMSVGFPGGLPSMHWPNSDLVGITSSNCSSEALLRNSKAHFSSRFLHALFLVLLENAGCIQILKSSCATICTHCFCLVCFLVCRLAGIQLFPHLTVISCHSLCLISVHNKHIVLELQINLQGANSGAVAFQNLLLWMLPPIVIILPLSTPG